MIVLNSRSRASSWSGTLIDFEGIDGSGKTTALTKVYERCKAEGRDVLWTEWADSKLTGKALKKGKKKHRMTPMTFTLLQACNIADRLQTLILPFLRKGGVVCADRWMYTSYARDVVRGCNRQWVRDVYDFCPAPDVTVYFQLDPEVALDRKLTFDDEPIAYYEAGQDIYPNIDPEDGFLRFQGEVKAEYDHFADKEGLITLDADQSMEAVEAQSWDLVDRVLSGKKAA